jgi:hypothetical protein
MSRLYPGPGTVVLASAPCKEDEKNSKKDALLFSFFFHLFISTLVALPSPARVIGVLPSGHLVHSIAVELSFPNREALHKRQRMKEGWSSS